MRQVTLVEVSDLLFHAQTLGYDWNMMCDKLYPLYPTDGAGTRTVDKGEYYGLGPEAIHTLETFFEENKLTHFTLTV